MEHTGDDDVCISSQAGCAFACAFCSTGQPDSRGISARPRSSTKRASSRASSPARKEDHQCGLMGMGEPFHNYDAVMGAVALLNDPHGFGLATGTSRSRRSPSRQIDTFAQSICK